MSDRKAYDKKAKTIPATALMKILLIGYGKMGKTIEQVATDAGHQVIGYADHHHPITVELMTEADVAIEFTQPEAAFDNILKCLQHQLPVVSGTTGWLARKPDLDRQCQDLGGTCLQASNFSIGVHLYLHIVRQASALLKEYPEYLASIDETHHTAKLDMPSGTALLVHQALATGNSRHQEWHLTNETDSQVTGIVPITSFREEDVPGTHTLKFAGPIDEISISHIAHNRLGFATGAVRAAEWIIGRKGIFTMADVLGLS